MHRGGNGHKTAGGGGWGDRRAHKTAGVCGITHPPRSKAAGGKAPQDRRRLTFFWWGAEIRRSRLRSLKSVLDVLRVPAARPRTWHFRAEHVAGKARSGGHRGASYPLTLQGPRGQNCRGRGGPKCTNCRARVAGYLELQGIDPPELETPNPAEQQRHLCFSTPLTIPWLWALEHHSGDYLTCVQLDGIGPLPPLASSVSAQHWAWSSYS
jgi:hypothetical protein